MNDQIDLFGLQQSEQDPVGLAAAALAHTELAGQLPSCLRFGTSSWTFPGWRNLVYQRAVSEQVLVRYGLASYAEHPLLRGVGLDRTYYSPMAQGDFARLGMQVPRDFRFLVKAHAALTTPAGSGSESRSEGVGPDRFLDPHYAGERVVEPAVAGLGDRLGVILFQFPPLGAGYLREPARFADRLSTFLSRLPRGPAYAVEVRNRELLRADYAEALADAGASHCFNIHPQMPDVLTQAEILGDKVWSGRQVSVRWVLHPCFEYEAASRRHFPFDRMADPDLRSRLSLVELVTRLLRQAQDVLVIANNKAEGSAPHSIVRLAEECVRHWHDRMTGEEFS